MNKEIKIVVESIHYVKGIVYKYYVCCVSHNTYSTRMLQSGYMDEYVQQLLGHKSIATTKDIYSHVLDEMSLDAYIAKEEEE